MISLIICSRTGTLPLSLENNIRETIGADYEIVLIDNSDNQYSIFQAYNIGVKKSRFAILCFMHDDILYHTQNWGNKVLKHFDDEKTGAIGIAGSPYAAYMPGSWWSSGLINEVIIPMASTDLKPVSKYYPDRVIDKNPAAVLDGVWMCIRRSLFDKISFDEIGFSGYHFYDIDISLQIHQIGYQLYCVFDVLIQHFSSGNMNHNWLNNCLLIQKKWQELLPVKAVPLSYAEQCDVELKTLNDYLDILLINNTPKSKIYQLVLLQFTKLKQAWFYYKSPVYLLKYMVKMSRYSNTEPTQ